ncbi:MAG TPA: hypothetical protein VMY36_03285 [Patescibacteria group bacterium]|nr:hypothetical protein [Patescibacteria group bacterium]
MVKWDRIFLIREKVVQKKGGEKVKKFLPIVIIAVVIVGGAIVAYMVLGKGGLSLPSVPGEIKKESGETGEEFVGKIKEVVARGVPMKCTYTQGDNTGTSYIKGKNIYGEMMAQGKQGYVIMKDKCMWSWNKDESQGVKMCFEEDIWETSEDYAQEGQASVASEAEYRCLPAIVSDSQFEPPANVNFMDMDQLMQGVEE